MSALKEVSLLPEAWYTFPNQRNSPKTYSPNFSLLFKRINSDNHSVICDSYRRFGLVYLRRRCLEGNKTACRNGET